MQSVFVFVVSNNIVCLVTGFAARMARAVRRTQVVHLHACAVGLMVWEVLSVVHHPQCMAATVAGHCTPGRRDTLHFYRPYMTA